MIIIKINIRDLRIGLLVVLLAFLIFPKFMDAEMSSNNFQIDKDVVGSFGNTSDSGNFTLGDTGGEFATGRSTGDNFTMEEAGFWDQGENYTISLNCTDSISMKAITGTGKSQWTGTENDALCVVTSNSPDGYDLTWQASSADMVTAQNDAISAYTPGELIPETWSVGSDTSEWGAKLMSTSDVYDSDKWGAEDTYTGGKWFNVDDAAPWSVISAVDSSAPTGDNEYLRFGAEIGSNKLQPTGTYQVDVTITVTAL